MLTRRLTRLLVLLLLLQTFFTGSAHAADSTPAPALTSLTYNQTVRPGDTVTFQVRATVAPDVGLCCGSLVLTGPSKQHLTVRLVKHADVLQGSLTLSPALQPGTWTVSSLRIGDNGGQETAYDDLKLERTLTVLSTGLPADMRGPELVSITAPDEAAMGEPVTIKATARDDSGIQSILAYVAPSGENPIWTDAVELFPTGNPDEFAGTMLMDRSTLAKGTQEITAVSLTDKAGNLTRVEGKDLNRPDNKLVTKGKTIEVPDSMLTSPYMNVIHPGNLAYWNWLTEDLKHTSALLEQGRTDVTAVRETIAAELPQLRQSVAALDRELHTDPVTKLRISPLATTGKWEVLERATVARFEILTELERREGKLNERRRELTSAVLQSIYSIVGKDEMWVPLEGSMAAFYAQVPVAYLKVLAASPEAVQALHMEAFESPGISPFGVLEPNVIYFEPVFRSDAPWLDWGSATIRVPMRPIRPLAFNVSELFYAIGQHLGQAAFSAPDVPDRSQRWQPYLTARGNQEWPAKIGFIGSAANNIGDDFAFSFLPLGLGAQYYSRQSYPRLRENPDLAAAFKKLVGEQLKRPLPSAPAIAPASSYEVGLGRFQASVTPAGLDASVHFRGYSWAKEGVVDQAVSRTSDSAYTFKADETTVGRIGTYELTARDRDGHNHYRYYYYFRAPVLLDPLPGTTNQQILKVTGTAPAGAQVSVGSQQATAGADGRFTVGVPLTAGVNRLRVKTAGSSLAAALQIVYEPETAPVKLSVDVPGVLNQQVLRSQGTTEPYALVTLNGMSGQADSMGNFPFSIPLKEGPNKLTLTAQTPAGNKAAWSGIVVVDTTPPALSVSLPSQANVPALSVTGKTDPGSTVTLGETVIPVGPDGSFTADVTLAENQTTTLKFVATDPAGNRSAFTGDTQYVKGVNDLTQSPQVTLYGAVPGGITLSYLGKQVPLSGPGWFNLNVDAKVGRNVYDILMSSDGKPAGFMQFVVLRPLQVDAPVRTEGDTVRISGATMPGWLVIVNNAPVAVNADGTWSVEIPKSNNAAQVMATGGGRLVRQYVPLP